MKRVIVIDDEPATNKLASEYLRLSGFEVIETFDGEEGLKTIKEKGPFDIAVIDIHMPGISGIDVCKTLKKDPAYAKLPVVMLSASSHTAEQQANLAGAEAFLSKPFSPKELVSVVKKLLPAA